MTKLYRQFKLKLEREVKGKRGHSLASLWMLFNAFEENDHLEAIPENRRLETILEILDMFSEDEQPLLYFLHNKGFIRKDSFKRLRNGLLRGAPEFSNEMKMFIRRKCKSLDSRRASDAWGPVLKKCLEVHREIGIFTTNYDPLFESVIDSSFSKEERVTCWDGFFEAAWDPAHEPEDYDRMIKLVKLHGSVTWYRTDSGMIGKYPYNMMPRPKDLDTQEPMIYPIPRKKLYWGIFLWSFRQLLDFLGADSRLVILGYSLADSQIVAPIVEALSMGSLRVLIVDPNATAKRDFLLDWYLAERGLNESASGSREHSIRASAQEVAERIEVVDEAFPSKGVLAGVEGFINTETDTPPNPQQSDNTLEPVRS
jgi:hypothetical protein